MPTPNLFPIAPQFQEMLAQLQRKLAESLMNADYEEQSRRRGYENELFNLGNMRHQGILQNTTNLADRGLGHSGIALKAESDLNRSFDQQGAEYGQEFNSALSELARKRLGSNEDFALGAGGLMRQSAGLMNPMTYASGAGLAPPPVRPQQPASRQLPPAPVPPRQPLMRLQNPSRVGKLGAYQ